jgi:hypothetical protein
MSHQRSSWPRHCRTLHNNWGLKTTLRAAVWRRTHIHPQRPAQLNHFQERNMVEEKMRTWCALQMRSRSCFWRNFVTTSGPNVNDTPRSLSPQPVMSLSGSDQSRSQSSPTDLVNNENVQPVSGTSVGRITRRTWSRELRSGDTPPCMQRIFSSMMAAMGRQLKASVNVFQILMLYRRLPAV